MAKVSSILRITSDLQGTFQIFDDFATKVAKEALEIYGMAGDDISNNKPLRENLLVVLTCVSLKIPVLICGKPGTSKTLAVEIAGKILVHANYSSKPCLQKFIKSEFSKFWGSLSTTSEGVRKKMNETIADQLKKRYTAEVEAYLKDPKNQKLTNKCLFFDEIGLAELAPDNPLKVLHSYLDPGSEDVAGDQRRILEERMSKIPFVSSLSKEKKENFVRYLVSNISFIGISNWRLDSSKSNRMIFVARPRMQNKDLVQTSESMLTSFLGKHKTTLSPFKREQVQKIFGIIADVF